LTFSLLASLSLSLSFLLNQYIKRKYIVIYLAIEKTKLHLVFCKMADSVQTLSASPLFVSDLSKDQPMENVVHTPPPPNESQLNNTNISAAVQHQPQSRNNGNSARSFVDKTKTQSLSGDQIETYQGWSILNTLCCCLCLGLAALHFSYNAKSLKQQGDIQGASNASKNALRINIVATIIGIFLIIITIMHHLNSLP
jgi:hypothetical protein